MASLVVRPETETGDPPHGGRVRCCSLLTRLEQTQQARRLGCGSSCETCESRGRRLARGVPLGSDAPSAPHGPFLPNLPGRS